MCHASAWRRIQDCVSHRSDLTASMLSWVLGVGFADFESGGFEHHVMLLMPQGTHGTVAGPQMALLLGARVTTFSIYLDSEECQRVVADGVAVASVFLHTRASNQAPPAHRLKQECAKQEPHYTFGHDLFKCGNNPAGACAYQPP